jgi:hypothetical protein
VNRYQARPRRRRSWSERLEVVFEFVALAIILVVTLLLLSLR